MRTLIKAFFITLLFCSPALADVCITHVDGHLFASTASAPPAGCTESSSFFVVTSTVGVSSDDATQLTTTMALTASTSAIVDATNEYFGAIFATVTIPSGATILGCTVQMYFPASGNDEPQHSVSLQYSTYAPTFATGASDISTRRTTSSSETWSSANLGAPGYFVSPNLVTQLTEVYNITGSLTNARLAVIVRGGATATRDFQVLTQDNGNVPQTPMLSLTYAISTTCYAQNFAIAYTSQTHSSASWTANSNNPSPTSYTLQYGTATDFTGTLVSSTTLNLFATVTGLTANTQYHARVRSDPDNFYSATASTRTPSDGSSGAITLVQATGDRLAGTNLALSLTGVNANHLLTMAGAGGDANAPTDNFGHTWSTAKYHDDGTNHAWVYYYVTTANYAGSYTVTKVAAGIAITASFAEFQNTVNTFSLDVTTGTFGSGTTYTTGASPTTASNCTLAVGAFGNQGGSNSAITDPAGWGRLFAEPDGATWLIGGSNFSTSTVSGVSLNPQWSQLNTTWGTVLATFKD